MNQEEKEEDIEKSAKEYKKKIQDFNQKQWEEPIDIDVLIYSNYDSFVLGRKKNEIVFINSDCELEYLTSYTLSPNAMDLLNDVLSMKSLPYDFLSSDQRKAFWRILGQGIVAAFSENQGDVKRCLDQANSFHKQAAFEYYKKHRFFTSTLCLAFVFVFYVLVNILCARSCNCSVMLLLSAAFGGCVGAFLSTCYKTGKKEELLSNDLCYIVMDVVVRFSIGALFAVIAYYFAKVGFFNLGENYYCEKIYLLSIAAGYSEKLIPNVLSRYQNKFVKDGCSNSSFRQNSTNCQSMNSQKEMPD